MARFVVQGVSMLLYAVAIAVLLWVSTTPELKKKYYVQTKMVCSLAFILYAVMYASISGHKSYFFLLLPILIFCALGDLFMAEVQVTKRQSFLALGIISFLVAHFGMIRFYFQLDDTFTYYHAIVPIVAVILFFVQARVAHMDFGKMLIPCLLYCVVLAFMLGKSTYYMVTQPSLTSVWLGVGAILFFISDDLIMYLYFYKFKKEKSRKIIHILNLTTYYFAVLAIDISILYYTL